MTAWTILKIAMVLLSSGPELYKVFREIMECIPKTDAVKVVQSKTSGKSVLPEYGPNTAAELGILIQDDSLSTEYKANQDVYG